MIQAGSSERRVFVDFGLHVIFGGVAFLLLLLVAVIIGAVARWLENHGYVSDTISGITDFAELALFIIDLLLFALLTIAEGLSLILGLWRQHGA
jgi:uncharacterized membrane protein